MFTELPSAVLLCQINRHSHIRQWPVGAAQEGTKPKPLSRAIRKAAALMTRELVG